MNRLGMDPQSWEELDELLEAALSVPIDARVAWLDELAEQHAKLRPTLERLLSRAAQVETGDFLERLPSLKPASEHAVTLQGGDTIGDYSLQRELGRGGMGAVWLANRDDGLIKRPVALKLPVVSDSGRGLAARMARERDILATLNHPHIARLYDAGIADDGRPYLALEYVEGMTLDEYCQTHDLGIDQRLDLFRQVTDAVAYAHARLVIHRDLKPSNILVTENGRVALLDFGIAKLLDAEHGGLDGQLTQTVGRVLTPDFAAPEQIRGDPTTVSSDVYSLGVILYLLLAQAPPYRLRAKPASNLESALAEVTIRRPSEVATSEQVARLRGDLDQIVLKALKADSEERYPSVESLADDLRRYRRGYPVSAQPDRFGYRLGKFIGRYRTGVVAATVVSSMVIGTTAFALVQLREARLQRDAALLQQQKVASTNQFYSLIMEELGTNNAPLGPLELLERGREMLEQQVQSSTPFAGHLYFELANRYGEVGQRDQQIEMLRTSERIAREQSDVDLLVTALCANSGGGLLNDVGATVQRLAEGRRLITESGQVSTLAQVDCLRLQAQLQQRDGNLDSTIALLNEALTKLRTMANPPVRKNGVLLNDLAAVYYSTGKMNESEALLNQIIALNDANGFGNTIGQFIVMANKGTMLGGLGEVVEDLAVWEKIYERATEGDFLQRLPNSFPIRYASTLSRLSRYDEALVRAYEGRERAMANGDTLNQAMADKLIGQLLTRRGQYEQGETHLNEAESILVSNRGRYQSQLLGIEIARAVLARHSGQPQLARERIQAVMHSIGYPNNRRNAMLQGTLWVATQIELDLGRPEEALALATEALAATTRRARDPLRSADVGKSRALRARAFAELGNVAAARQEFELALPSLVNGLGADNAEVSDANKRLSALGDTAAPVDNPTQ